MHLVNAMFSAARGGLEQAALNYTEALVLEGHRVTTILNPNSPLKEAFRKTGSAIIELSNFGERDFIARFRARSALKKLQPDCVITHGRRAAKLFQNLHPRVFPVAHSGYQPFLRNFPGVITMTNHLRQEFIQQGYPSHQIYHVPNMVHVNREPQVHEYHVPIRLGAMGRLEEKKGFHILIRAAKILYDQGEVFHLTIAGEGGYKKLLKQLVKELCLEKCILFPGWVKKPTAFFESIDIFCMPSLKEPFGIVLIEAFCSGVPTVATDADGPQEIATHHKDALIVSKDDPVALAEAIKTLMKNQKFAKQLAKNAFEKVQNVYDIKTVAKRLTAALYQLLERT